MKLRKLVNFAAAITVLGTAVLAPTHVFAENGTTSNDSICGNTNISAEIRAASGCPEVDSVGELPSVIQGILNAIILVSGTVAVIYIVIGGVQYMTSTGDPGKTQKAKNTILYALIGLVVCALSFAIVNWAIYSIGGGQSSESSSQTEE